VGDEGGKGNPMVRGKGGLWKDDWKGLGEGGLVLDRSIPFGKGGARNRTKN